MTVPFYRYLEVAAYALLNFLPFMILALIPFSQKLRFSKAITRLLIISMSLIQIVLGLCAAFFFREYVGILSVVSTLLSGVFYFAAVKAHWGKSLFALLLLSNIANFVVISAKSLEAALFPAYVEEAYRWSCSLCTVLVLALVVPPLAIYFHKRFAPIIQKRVVGVMWRYLWFVPGVFYLIWYWNLYDNGGSSLEMAMNPMNALYLFLVNVGAFFIYQMILRLVHEQEKIAELEEQNHQLSLQSIQYDSLKERINEAHRAKHDIRHHVTLLQEYYRKGEYDKLGNYLERYHQTVPDESAIILCKNYAVNALLVYFGQQANGQDTDFDVKAELPEQLPVAETDLSVILGNLLENSLHACAEQTKGMRKIILRTKSDGNSVFLTVDNTYGGKLRRDEDGNYLTSKTAGSGLGLSSVRAITERYRGVMDVEEKDGLFCVSVMLNG